MNDTDTSEHENWVQEQTKPKPFWCVWKENGGSAPQKRHDTFESAQSEAARLSQQENARYFVLMAVGIVAPKKIPVNYYSIDL